jgi:hypothetical protein
MATPDVRLYHRAVVVAQEPGQGALRGLVRQLSNDQFENESRRVSMGGGTASDGTATRARTPAIDRCAAPPVSRRAGASFLLRQRGRSRGGQGPPSWRALFLGQAPLTFATGKGP